MKKYVFFWGLIGLYLLVFFVNSYTLYKRLGVFGCGDECINYTAAHFLNYGKHLYTQVFFNRQPLMAYASQLVQVVTHPDSLYTLVLYHRLAVMAYALAMGVFLIWRFRFVGLLFLLLYEGTKYYVYGYQFIGESIIVYPLVYMLGVVWQSKLDKMLFRVDAVLVPLFGAIVFWTREPYIPAAAALLISFLWIARKVKTVRMSMLLSILLLTVPYIWIPISEYYRQVVTVNIPAVGGALGIRELMYAYFYPVVIFFSGKQSFFRLIEIGISVFVGVGAFFWIRQTKKAAPIVLMFGLLGTAAIRSVLPGTMYFEAFHMLPWYGLYCMLCAILVGSISIKPYKVFVTVGCVLFALWAFAAPRAFIWEKVDRQVEFDSQYAKYTHYSTAIKIITSPSQKIFLDIWDDVIYWESNRDSAYLYSLFIPVAAAAKPYTDARISMFQTSPPDVYYSCPALQTPYNTLPENASSSYTQLYSQGLPSCLYVRNSVVGELSYDQIEALGRNEFSIPKVP